MVLKRQLSEGEGDGSRVPVPDSKRRFASSSVSRNVMHGLSSQELAARLEPLLRGWVRDEVERACGTFCFASPRTTLNPIEPCRVRTLQLHFQAKLPSTLFTGTRLESEDDSTVKLVLLDANSKKIVTSGPLSSMKLEIVPLDGDFTADDQEDWHEKEFDAKVVHAREGKRPLVTGELVVTLREGVGVVGDVSFTDNSSWRRSRKFRLGARVLNIPSGVRIREARSEAFVVKDHRGESYKKHHPPCLNDDIWRLEKIAKDGVIHERLTSYKIYTVKDFLRLYVTDPSSLRILGGFSNKTWEIIIKHATACVLDDKLYLYHCAAEGIGLVFNSIFKVVKATFDGQSYLCLDKLDAYHMHMVEAMKQQAYRNLDGLVPVNEPSMFGPPMLSPSLQAEPFRSASIGLQDVNIPVPHQDQLQMQLGFNCMTTSQPYMYEVEDSGQLEVPMTHNARSMQVFSPALRNSFIMKDFCNAPYGKGFSSCPNGSLGSVLLTGRLASDYDYQDESSLWQGNELCLAPTNQAVDIASSDFGIHFLRNGKPRVRWCKIRAAIKWVSVRRDVAAKRMAKWRPSFDYSTLIC